MSRSNNTNIQNPANRFFGWSGSEGKVKWYDKEAGENKYEKMPFTFLVLDVLTTITGYSDSHQSGIYSNEIRDTRKDHLVVRTKGGILAEGTYEQVKGVQGAKYAASVYIAYKTEGGLQIGNLKLSGSAIGPFIEFRKRHDIYSGAISITGSTAEKKGATKYFAPVFEVKPVSEDTDNVAKGLDEQLQQYLKTYFNKAEEIVHDEVTVNENFVTAAAGAISSSINGTQVQDGPNDNWHENEPPEGFEDSLPF